MALELTKADKAQRSELRKFLKSKDREIFLQGCARIEELACGEHRVVVEEMAAGCAVRGEGADFEIVVGPDASKRTSSVNRGELAVRLLKALGQLSEPKSVGLSGSMFKNVDFLLPFSSVERLDLSHCKNLTNVDGLANLKSLTHLNIEVNPNRSKTTALKSVAGLEGLEALTHLNLMGNELIEDLTPLAGLTQLEVLNTVRVWKPKSAEHLIGKKKLTSLEVQNFPGMTTLDIFADCVDMESLLLTNCGVADVSSIAGLEKLTRLRINGCSTEQLEALAALPRLKHLEMRTWSASSADALAGLKGLESLDLSFSRELLNVDGLKSLTHLTGLPLRCGLGH